MFLSSRDNQFKFLFPRIMFPQEIIDKYKPYYERIQGSMITDPVDVFNYSIQSFSLPGPEYEPITQNDHPGMTRNYRNIVPTNEVYSKDFSVTLQSIDGFSNYFMALDLFNYYYDFQNREQHLPCSFDVQVIDTDSNVLASIQMNEIIFKSVSGLEFNFSSNSIDFKTFELGFTYNLFDTKLNFKA